MHSESHKADRHRRAPVTAPRSCVPCAAPCQPPRQSLAPHHTAPGRQRMCPTAGCHCSPAVGEGLQGRTNMQTTCVNWALCSTAKASHGAGAGKDMSHITQRLGGKGGVPHLAAVVALQCDRYAGRTNMHTTHMPINLPFILELFLTSSCLGPSCQVAIHSTVLKPCATHAVEHSIHSIIQLTSTAAPVNRCLLNNLEFS
jgi:hypothetical protein